MQTGTEKKEIQKGNKKMMNRNRITEGTNEGRHMKAKTRRGFKWNKIITKCKIEKNTRMGDRKERKKESQTQKERKNVSRAKKF